MNVLSSLTGGVTVMEAIRGIVSAESLRKIMNIPDKLDDVQFEIVATPIEESRAEKYKRILARLEGSVPDSGESYEDMLQDVIEEKYL